MVAVIKIKLQTLILISIMANMAEIGITQKKLIQLVLDIILILCERKVPNLQHLDCIVVVIILVLMLIKSEWVK